MEKKTDTLRRKGWVSRIIIHLKDMIASIGAVVVL
jgi:hypothetical protein